MTILLVWWSELFDFDGSGLGSVDVEFGFGDWEWYARAQEQWHRVFATVLWPTRGTLARREHFASDAAALRASMPWATFDQFVVEAADAARLRERLEAQFAAANLPVHLV